MLEFIYVFKDETDWDILQLTVLINQDSAS